MKFCTETDNVEGSLLLMVYISLRFRVVIIANQKLLYGYALLYIPPTLGIVIIWLTKFLRHRGIAELNELRRFRGTHHMPQIAKC